MTEGSEAQPRFFYGWIVAGSFSLLMVASWGMSQGTFGVLVKPLTEETEWSRTAASAAFSIHLLISFVIGVFWGWLSDRWGVRRVIAATGALMGLGFYLSGTVQALWQLYVYFGFIGGVGLGGSAGPLTAIATRWFEKRRGLAIGIGFAGGSIGTALLAILAEFLISNQGWRSAFQMLSYVIWGVFLAGLLLLREPSSRERPAQTPRPTAGGERLPASSLGEAAVPLSGAVRTRVFWTLFGMMSISTMIFFLVLVHLVPRALDVGIASPRAVNVFTANSICTMVGTLAGGGLGDRFGPKRVFIVAMVFYAAGLLLLASASELWMFFLSAIVFGLGNGAWSPQIPALASRSFGTRYMGAIWGALLLGAGIGGTVGPIMAGFVFDSTGSYRIAFTVGAVIAGAGIAMALLLRVSARRAA